MKWHRLIHSHSFKFFLSVSILLHIFLLCMFLSDFSCSADKKIIIQESIKVRVVDFPEKEKIKKIKAKKKKPAKRFKKKAKKKKAKKKKTKKKLKNKKSKKRAQALNLAKKQALALKKQKRKEAQGAAFKKIEELKQAATALKKQKEKESYNDLKSYAYFSKIKRHIQSEWNLPNFLVGQNLRATLNIQFDQGGHITKLSLEEPSGNETFDALLLETVKAASPLPLPPEEVRKDSKYRSIWLKFPD